MSIPMNTSQGSVHFKGTPYLCTPLYLRDWKPCWLQGIFETDSESVTVAIIEISGHGIL